MVSSLPILAWSQGSWQLQPESISICKRPDGSDHVLGRGTYGVVSLSYFLPCPRGDTIDASYTAHVCCHLLSCHAEYYFYLGASTHTALHCVLICPVSPKPV